MSIESYYIAGRFEVHGLTRIDDGAGSFTESLAKTADVSGRMRPLTGREILANEKLSLETSHRFYCPVITIDEDDFIYDTVSGKYYEVKYVRNPMEMNHHLEIDCLYKKDHQ